MSIDQKLVDLGIELPDAPVAGGNFVPARIVGPFLYISGQVPVVNGKDQHVGQLGAEITLEQGQDAARLCALNILAQARIALGGDLGRIRSCIRLGGFVNAAPGFGLQPKVINGASDLMGQVMGEAGRHVRVAVGCSSLPRNVAVEIEALFEIDTK
ncbi:RidA family protein [Ottowia thiooxydans]|uniref:RidA family protein n=1 Tax=Ottowia thiooxydans TaxID=219182 RepID=UPI00041577F2|nr:RidA family protein [Ottowia thiooxydans]